MTTQKIRLGIGANLGQFSLLVGVNALVGGMLGQERTILPLIAEDEFGLTGFKAALTLIVAFGLVKAATNFFAGTLSDPATLHARNPGLPSRQRRKTNAKGVVNRVFNPTRPRCPR